MYTQAVARVRYMGNHSDQFHCGVGVRQGCCLSPTLFLVYACEGSIRIRRFRHPGRQVGQNQCYGHHCLQMTWSW